MPPTLFTEADRPDLGRRRRACSVARLALSGSRVERKKPSASSEMNRRVSSRVYPTRLQGSPPPRRAERTRIACRETAR